MKYLLGSIAALFLFAATANAQFHQAPLDFGRGVLEFLKDIKPERAFVAYTGQSFEPGSVVGGNGLGVSGALLFQSYETKYGTFTPRFEFVNVNKPSELNQKLWMSGVEYQRGKAPFFAYVTAGANQVSGVIDSSSFAVEVGGGIELKANDRFSFRPMQFSYLRAPADAAGKRNFPRFAAGIVINLP